MFGTGTTATIIFTAISGWFLMSGNLTFPQLNRNVKSTLPASTATLPVVRGPDGRIYMTVSINNKAVKVIVDTAASHSVLREEDARAVNIQITGQTQLRTAGGSVSAKEGLADTIAIAGTKFENHRVLIAKNLPVSLLGMDVLKAMDGFSIQL